MRLRFILILLLIWTVVIFFYLLLSIKEESAVSLSKKYRMSILSLFPEGWGFFTKNVREEKILVYKKEQDKWKIVNIPGGSPKYIFGLDRKGRTIQYEIAQFLGESKNDWSDIETDINETITIDTMKVDTLFNSCPDPKCLGKILVQKILTMPWAWSDKNVIMPSKIKTFYIKNSGSIPKY